MLSLDLYRGDAFRAVEMQTTIDDVPFVPQALGDMGLFEAEPIRTTIVGLRNNIGELELVPTTERGTPETLVKKDRKDVKWLETFSLRQRDRLNALELQGVLSDSAPEDVNLENAMTESLRRMSKMKRQVELTREYHRFNAINGILLDADGSEIADFYELFGIVKPAAIEFDLDITNEESLRAYVAQMIARPMRKALKGRRNGRTRIGALVGDEFFDKLITHPQVERSYLNYQAARELLEELPIFGTFNFAGVTWMNYEGTDDDTTIALAADEARFFPIGATDCFKMYLSPDEEFDTVNSLGREWYPIVSPDYRPNMNEWVDHYLRTHPLFACLCPQALLSAELAA